MAAELEIIKFVIYGFFIGLALDIGWWRINRSKYEKGLEAHEHYHIGFELGIIGAITGFPIFYGLMLAFVLAEWAQDHPFALKSKHFKESTIIGVILIAILITVEIIF